MTRCEEFLDLYKQMESELEEKYRGKNRRYSSIVFEFTKDYESSPVREKLETCRGIRNLLTHSANMGGVPIVEPSQAVVDAMREVLNYVSSPPLGLDFATKGEKIMKTTFGQNVLRLMDIMDKNGFSHVPVMRDSLFCGVFSMGAVFKFILSGGIISENSIVGDLEDCVKISSRVENYLFMPKDTSYIGVRRAFERMVGKNKRISAIFITETGAEKEKLLGMITPWDVMGE